MATEAHANRRGQFGLMRFAANRIIGPLNLTTSAAGMLVKKSQRMATSTFDASAAGTSDASVSRANTPYPSYKEYLIVARILFSIENQHSRAEFFFSSKKQRTFENINL